MLAVVAVLYYSSKFSHVALLWAAFILTRPLGATVANSLDKPVGHGGLGVNDLMASATIAGLMIIAPLAIPQRPAQKGGA